MKPIDKKDLFEQDLFEKLKEGLDSVLSSTTKLDEELKKVANTLKNDLKQSNETTINGLAKIHDIESKSNKLFKESLANDKIKEQVQGQIIKNKQAEEVLKQKELKTEEQLQKQAERKIKQQEKELKALEEESNAYIKLSKEKLRVQKESKRLGAELLALKEAGKLNTEEYKKLSITYSDTTKRAKDLNNQLVDLDQATGDNSRVVGNYSEEVKKAIGDMGFFGREIEIVRKAKNRFSLVLKTTKNGFSNMTSSVRKAGFSLKGLTQGLKLFRIALIATGVGALVVALGSLVVFLTSTQKGMDFVNKKLSGLKYAFQSIIGVFQVFGEKLFNLFSSMSEALEDPKKAIKELGDSIYNEIMVKIEAAGNLFKGFFKMLTGDFEEGALMMKEATIDIVPGMRTLVDVTKELAPELKKAYEEGERLGDEIFDIEKKLMLNKIKNTVAMAENNLEYAKALQIARDVEKTEQDRLKALNKAEKLYAGISEIRIEELKLELQLLEKKAKANDTPDADLLEIEEKKAEILAEMKSTEENITSFLKLRFSINSKIKNQIKQNKEEELKYEELLLKIKIEQYRRNLDNLIQEKALRTDILKVNKLIFENEKKLIIDKYEFEKKEAQNNKVLLKTIEANFLNDMEVLKNAYEKKNESLFKEKTIIRKKTNTELYALEQEALNNRFLELTLITKRTIKNEEELNKRLEEISISRLEKDIELRKKHNLNSFELEVQLIDLLKKQKQKEEQAQAKALKERKDLEQAALKSLNDNYQNFIDDRVKMNELFIKENKTQIDRLIALSESGVDSAKESLKEQLQAEREALKEQERLRRQKEKAQFITTALTNVQNQLAQGKDISTALATTVGLEIALRSIFAGFQGFYKGTENAPEGLAWVHEKGGEIITDKKGNIKEIGGNEGAKLKFLSKGDKVINHQKTMSILKENALSNNVKEKKSNNSDAFGLIEQLKKLTNKEVNSTNISAEKLGSIIHLVSKDKNKYKSKTNIYKVK